MTSPQSCSSHRQWQRALFRLAQFLFVLTLGVVAANTAALAHGREGPPRSWVATWGTSPDSTGPAVEGQTIRAVVRISMGGKRLRVRLSNEMGTTPLVVGAAHIALAGIGSSTQPNTDRTLTFGGLEAITIPPGAPALSDPVDFPVAPLSQLAISIFVPENTGPATVHQFAERTSYISTPGDYTGSDTMPVASTATSWFFLSAIYVSADRDARTIVAFGDSITEGLVSTVDADKRWTDRLAERLVARRGPDELAVVNAGISGNRVLHDFVGPNALNRFDRDVLSQPGVEFVTLLEGVNDLGFPGALGRPEESVTAEDIIQGYRQIIARAHVRGIKVIGGTILPYGGTLFPGYFTPEGEAKRQLINRFVRASGEFDGVIDFDAAVRDPANPTRLLAAYDSGDGLHPNDAGYTAMGDAVDLKLFDTHGEH